MSTPVRDSQVEMQLSANIPLLTHCWEHCSNFLSSAALRAKPDMLTKFETILGYTGEVLVIFRAAGCPVEKQGKHTFPSRELVSGIMFFARKLATG